MRQLLILAAVVLLSGCICCGGNGIPGTSTGSPTTLEGQACEKPYIQVGTECCLDENDNGICDSDETTETTQAADNTPPSTEETATTQPQITETTQAPATTQPSAPQTTATTITTTTTLAAPAGALMTLGGGWQEFKQGATGTGYMFRFDSTEGSGQSMKYIIEIKTPDGITDKRPISNGESFVDSLRFKVTNYGQDKPTISIRVNAEDSATVAAAHPEATLVTIGGQSCWPGPTAMCERNYKGYTIQLISRFGSDGQYATIGVTPPGMGMTKLKVPATGIASPDGTLVVGGFFDNTHFILGGYNLFYVYTT